MHIQDNYTKKFILFFFLFVGILSSSISGYMVLEKWEFFDALYMTIITLATIGYGETHELSFWGRIHTIFVILIGVGFFSSMLLYFSSLLIEGEFRNFLIQKARLRKINNLENHYIICGYGRIGREVCQELKAKKFENILVIDKDQEQLQDAYEHGFLVFRGDATNDEDLISVGIKNAKGIVCALTDDALNVFITLSARVLSPDINIISRADHSESVAKLKRAGANIVVSPYIIGGKRIASAVTNPLVMDFLDTVLHNPNFDLTIEELKIKEKSELDGVSLALSSIKNKSGSIVIAIKKANGELISNPTLDQNLNSGDTILAMGTEKQLNVLDKMCSISSR